MKTDANGIKMSHIIVDVDKRVTKLPLSSFCTNVKNKNPEIRFTYLSYDNQIPGDAVAGLVNLPDSYSENPNSLFIITDSEDVILYIYNKKIAGAALYTPFNRRRSFSKVLYCIEDIEYMSYERINRMWQRFYGIPWTITDTDRLVIREQTVDDIPGLYEIYSDSEAARFTESLYDDIGREREYMQQYIDNQYRFFEYGVWALTLKESGKLIGRAGLSARDGYDTLEIGYIIGKPYRGCGYAQEAVRAIIRYAEEELDVHGFSAFTKEENRASVRLLEGLGFVKRKTDEIKGGVHDVYFLTKQQLNDKM